ncbi:5'-3' exonuclease [Propionicimonas sp.]|uniref:5'-3' exonuclease n=1 Tax=Propionicimonas sp. TaxID=1955623 RepID=UPI0017FDCE7B|nr:5'-3' exonuclease [Propionicimonas sp.]MBU3977320.1 5'-3' exonuclease [Actinomycetota bacterium]MBA3021245.1 5'-3' exonuclease [Propionicimonas sp.]MBU3985830.1 5'-3' exonuclease [Actinomycetota bacterium]MBU4008615.1 5'-3' exonuclease [Actinomycetota bacterium]MBU4066235.1 5'-3' exonuclease [Actinomycetota bacterium]
MSEPRMLLFDTASVYFRAFFGLPSSLRSPDGRQVNAVRGLLDYLARFITDYSPTQVAYCWDNSWRPAWRVALVPSYKAQRVAYGDVEVVPAELTAQVPLIRDVLDALGIPVIGADGYEADDVIATMAKASSVPTEVVTGDRDLFQVVDDAAAVRVLYLGRGAGRHDRVDGAWLRERYGVSPDQYVDFAVLRGDPSDGLPGVAGIGEKTAAGLLASHHDLEQILAAAQQGLLAPRVTAALAASVDYLGAAREVVSAAVDVPVPAFKLELSRSPADPARFERLSAELGLGGSAARLIAALAQARST